MRSDFQGLAVAEARLFGEPVRARQLAIERIELVVGILRFFAPAHRDGKVVSRIARWGYAPERTETVFVADSTGRCSNISTALIDRPARALIDDEMREFLLGAGLSEVREIVAREKRTDLEQELLTGMVTFGRAALTPDLRERIVWYCAGLESILLKNSSEPILQNLGERLAMFAYDTIDERSAALADVRTAYSLRSSFAHHGVDIEDREAVNRFVRHGLRFFLRVAKNINRFSNKEQILDHIDRMKLSGRQPIYLNQRRTPGLRSPRPASGHVDPGDWQLHRRRRQGAPHRGVNRARDERLADGFRFRFTADAELLAAIAGMIDAERRCCRFLRFQLTAEPDEGPVWLEVTGPPGTDEFLAGWGPAA
jgi:hypothetical protein